MVSHRAVPSRAYRLRPFVGGQSPFHPQMAYPPQAPHCRHAQETNVDLARKR